VIVPWLDGLTIDNAAAVLRRQCVDSQKMPAFCIDLDSLIYDHLSESDELSFDDEIDLGREDGEEVLGRTLPLAGKIQITRSLKLDPDRGRYRFTVAHEIGHWVLHRPLYLGAAENLDLFASGESAALTSLNRSVFPREGNRGVPREEWQANRFAMGLLIDPDSLRREFVRRYGDPPAACSTIAGRDRRANSLRNHSTSLARSEVNGIPSLREMFGISAEAMAIALETRGYAVPHAPAI
jgi:hypothetical protein